MAGLPYEFYVDIVTKRYFEGVDKFDMDLVLGCFHEDAVLTEVPSMTVHEGREAGIRTMFEGLFAAHSRTWHGNSVHTAEVQSEAICSQFSVEVTPNGADNELRYENCNRFYLKDGKFSRVFVYMSGENLLR